jgi:integrase
MSRPWKHPNSGVYWLRKGVPEDLRKLVGKREEKRSLQTRDPVEAKRRHAEALAEIEGRWANLRAGPKALTEREAHQLAVAVHDRWLQQHLENPSQQTAWNVDLADRLFAPPRKLKSYDILDPDFEASMDPESRQISRMEKWCFEIADECLAAHGLLVDETKQGEKKRSFTDSEAKLVLRAALDEKDPVRRWVPWIGAYSGARISEICQLRSQDIIQIDNIWCMKLDPEAGSLKTRGSERIIPLHDALIENGFLKFVATVKSGPLFASLSPDKFGKRGGNGTKVIGRFVRQLGLTDTRLSPSHSWRHRIKTLGRKYGLAEDILDAITGHGARSVADSYGEFPVEALFREISKIPKLEL